MHLHRKVCKILIKLLLKSIMCLDYDDLARILREIDEKDDVIVTVLQGIYITTLSTNICTKVFSSHWQVVLRVCMCADGRQS